jgi:hypothetical protein
MDAFSVVTLMEADETTPITGPAVQETAPMAGSKHAASVGRDTKLKVPKKVLTK